MATDELEEANKRINALQTQQESLAKQIKHETRRIEAARKRLKVLSLKVRSPVLP